MGPSHLQMNHAEARCSHHLRPLAGPGSGWDLSREGGRDGDGSRGRLGGEQRAWPGQGPEAGVQPVKGQGSCCQGQLRPLAACEAGCLQLLLPCSQCAVTKSVVFRVCGDGQEVGTQGIRQEASLGSLSGQDEGVDPGEAGFRQVDGEIQAVGHRGHVCPRSSGPPS